MQRLRRLIGLLAVTISLFFGLCLLLVMFGVSPPTQLAGYKISFVQFFRTLAEITVGGLLLAALAFL
jgi:hypothetical protein